MIRTKGAKTRPAKRKLALFLGIFTVMFNLYTSAQTGPLYVRIASIIVDSTQLDRYKAALKEGVETAVRMEPGVVSLQAVYDENKPTHVTVFEVYASKEAYRLHIQTPHFKKYKEGTQMMVKSLELTDVVPISLATKHR